MHHASVVLAQSVVVLRAQVEQVCVTDACDMPAQSQPGSSVQSTCALWPAYYVCSDCM